MNPFYNHIGFLLMKGHSQPDCVFSVINKDSIGVILSYLSPDDFPYTSLLIPGNLTTTVKENHHVVSYEDVFPMPCIFHVGRLHVSFKVDSIGTLIQLMDEIKSSDGEVFLHTLVCQQIENREWRAETWTAINAKNWFWELNGRSLTLNKDRHPNGWMPDLANNKDIYSGNLLVKFTAIKPVKVYTLP